MVISNGWHRSKAPDEPWFVRTGLTRGTSVIGSELRAQSAGQE